MTAPFHITGYTFTDVKVVTAIIGDGRMEGRGEATGVYYLDDGADAMVEQIETHRAEIEAGASREHLRRRMKTGGARNAVDCALWELEAQRAGTAVWQLAGISAPRPLVTTFTLGADDPMTMAAGAQRFAQALALKLKLTGQVDIDIERVRAVRAARPDVWMGVDANQGFTPDTLHRLMPTLLEAQVRLIEQPFPRGREGDLDGLDRPIPIAADESAQELVDVLPLVGRFDVVNIKLDKCGGLTEGLLMAAEARRHGLAVMVGNMVGTSWAMAPGFVLGQLCDIVDLDGPLYITTERSPRAEYQDGKLWCPEQVWGGRAPR